MKKIGKLSFEQFKKFAFTDIEFSEVALQSYPVIHFGEFNVSFQEESYGNDTHGWNGFVNGSPFCIKEVSSQKAIKAAYECYVYDCSELGYEKALRKLLYPTVLYSQTVIPADVVGDGSDIGTYLNELLCEKMKTGAMRENEDRYGVFPILDEKGRMFYLVLPLRGDATVLGSSSPERLLSEENQMRLARNAKKSLQGEEIYYLKVKGRLEGFTYFKGKLADVLQEGWE